MKIALEISKAWLIFQRPYFLIYFDRRQQIFLFPPQTGSGKTLAFALPVVQTLSVDPYGIYALVLTPTRELAIQIADQFRIVGKPINIRVAVIVGGVDQVQQVKLIYVQRI